MTPAERLLIAVLTAIQVLHLTDFVLMMPLGPQLMRVFAITPAQFALLVSAYTFAAALGGLLGSLVIDRFDRKRALLALFAGFTLANVACALAPGYHALMGARVLAGGFGGVLGAMLFAIVGDYVAPQRRGQATGILMAGFAIASVLGVPAGLWLAAHWSWQVPFAVLSGFSLLIWLLAAVTLPVMRRHLVAGERPAPVAALLAVVREREHWPAFALTTCMMFGGFSVIPFVSPFLVANVGLTEHHLALVYLIGGICTVVSSPWIGRLSDRHGAVRVFTIVAGASLVPLLVLTHLPRVGEVTTLVVTSVFIVLVSGRFVPAMTLVTGSAAAHQRGAFMAVNSSLQSLASGLAATAAGLVIAQPDPTGPLLHYGMVGIGAALATVAAMLLAPRVVRRG